VEVEASSVTSSAITLHLPVVGCFASAIAESGSVTFFSRSVKRRSPVCTPIRTRTVTSADRACVGVGPN
jgi:hypothetical protein